MSSVIWLRLEGVAIGIVALWMGWSASNWPWWVNILMLVAPDLAIIGYTLGNRWGARVYNLAHSYTAPALLLVYFGTQSIGYENQWIKEMAICLLWIAHIGLDRALGYGLKEETGFKDTHLGRIGRNG